MVERLCSVGIAFSFRSSFVTSRDTTEFVHVEARPSVSASGTYESFVVMRAVVSLPPAARTRRGVVGVLLLLGVVVSVASGFPSGSSRTPSGKRAAGEELVMANNAVAWAKGTERTSGVAGGDTSASVSTHGKGRLVDDASFGADVSIDRSNGVSTRGGADGDGLGKVSGNKASSQKECVADPAHVPKVTESEKAVILKYVTGAFAGSAWQDGEARYLEWGGGGSTSAFGTKAKLVHTVEHAPVWCDSIAQWDEMKCLTKNNKWELFCHDSGMTLKKWGYPEDGSGDKWHSTKPKSAKELKTDYAFAENMRAYVQAPGRDQFTSKTTYYDVVLIDGRFRSACAYAVLPFLKENSVVLWHDFGESAWRNVPENGGKKVDVNKKSREPTWHGDRFYSKAASRLFDGVEHVDNLAVFRVKPSVLQQMRWLE